MVAQYYNFFRLGFNGYQQVQQAARDVATRLAQQIGARPEFRLVSLGDQLPVFAFTTSEAVTGWDVFALSRALRERGWQVPAYSFPENRQDLAIQRILVRHDFSRDLADLLLDDYRRAIEHLASNPPTTSMSAREASGFALTARAVQPRAPGQPARRHGAEPRGRSSRGPGAAGPESVTPVSRLAGCFLRERPAARYDRRGGRAARPAR